jgi:signal transduction histidine kinase
MLVVEIISLLFVIVINGAIGWLMAAQGWKVAVNRYFILAVFSIIFWALGTLLFLIGSNHEISKFGIQLFYIAPMFSIVFLSLFATVFPSSNSVTFRIVNGVLLTITVLFATLIAVDQNLLTNEITLNASQGNMLAVNPFWYQIYLFYFNTAFMVAFSSFYVQIRKNKGQTRKQLIAIFIGTFLAAAFSLITNLILPLHGNSQFIWLGPTWSLFYIITVTISIVKHQLFDIKLAAVRGVAYIGVLLSLSAIYYFVAYILSVFVFGAQASNGLSVSPINILLALMLTFLFQPIKKFFDQMTDNFFYKDRYKVDDFYAEFSELLASTTDLRGLFEKASHHISATFKTEQAFFFAYYFDNIQRHMSAGTQHHNKIPLADVSIIDDYMSHRSDSIIITDTLNDNESLRRMLVSHKVSLVMPLRRSGNVVGYLFLGDLKSGRYSKTDLRVLATVSDELVVAIQNAISIQEVKELNSTLQQRIDSATKELRSSNSQLRHLDEVKDEFMSMASHQLRTPLTSIKGYLSMVLEEDMGKITPQQRTVLNEAFNSSERMVRLIADFLNVSRLQTGKFIVERNPADIVSVVRSEVESLKMIAGTHDMKLDYRSKEKELIIPVDEAKIRQVIMNFIDNAIYYSRADSTITVSLEVIENDLAFKVIDTGIGVPKDEQEMLFNKFFRAKNARQQRPDGTGVGLYLAKKVVTAHGGKMIFASEEGQGSTFGFRIPIVKATSQSRDE